MSPERNWRMRVEDILACIKKIKGYTQGMTYKQFFTDGKTVDAVIRNLEIIGEAAGYVPGGNSGEISRAGLVGDAWNEKYHGARIFRCQPAYHLACYRIRFDTPG